MLSPLSGFPAFMFSFLFVGETIPASPCSSVVSIHS